MSEVAKMQIGRIILEGETVEPCKLLDLDGVVLVEIVDGQYRIERLKDEGSTKNKDDSPKNRYRT